MAAQEQSARRQYVMSKDGSEKVEGVGTLDFLGTVGRVATILGQSPKYCQYPVAVIPLWLEPAIRHRQINFFLNESDIAVGYVTWAWLTEDTEARFIRDPTIILHISEWNEGDRLWILDFVLNLGDLRDRLREVLALFKDERSAKSLRRRDDGTVRKVTTWRRSLFASTLRQRR